MIKHQINLEFFREWSHDLAYVLGFLFADGNIVKTNRGSYFVSIYTADRALLHSVRQVIGSGHKISRRKSLSGSVYRLQIGSKELFELVSKRFGLVPHKTKRMRIPKVPIKYAGSFIRGYFDGDGNVWYGKTHQYRKKTTPTLLVCFTSASFFFLDDLFHLLQRLGLQGGSLYLSKKGTFSRLSFSTRDALKMYQIMYNGSQSLFLKRKKRVFERYMRP